ncbi:U19-ctenitoxin-Pn1a-like [Ruditapes philippinarum]|uniref:U19-ctenitoxin-Pn1a-like n=1 Tax=Ruditapes philippinarum TaxID=129788 RepID=UPI00295B6BEC|nr:U19-ctenitoxin-Pn1a-like [Ruditapes philippinarum]
MRFCAIFIVTFSIYFVLAQSCTQDSDCPGGCCYSDRLHGAKCHQFQNESQGCHLPNHNHTVMLYPCGCKQGLTCDEIHFTPGLGGDPVHQAELLLLGHGYGICTSTPGQVFG